MEYVVAALVLLFAIGYAVVIAVNIEKGKSWAIEIARAISMLDPESVSYHLRQGAWHDREVPPAPTPDGAPRPELDRLAA